MTVIYTFDASTTPIARYIVEDDGIVPDPVHAGQVLSFDAGSDSYALTTTTDTYIRIVTYIQTPDTTDDASWFQRESIKFTDLSGNVISGPAGAVDQQIEGTPGKDSLKGGTGDDVLLGHAGNDTLKADAGNDDLFGGSGHDHLYGGDGNDFLNGGSGDDSLDGGKGDDVLNGGAGTDIESGGDGNDIFRAGLDAGNDALKGGKGINTVDYSAAKAGMTIDLKIGLAYATSGDSGTGIDKLSSIQVVLGSSHDDSIRGSDSNDTIYGGAGNDIIIGGKGGDTLTGGQGGDIFTYLDVRDSSPGRPDHITDFTVGEDKIDLSAIDAIKSHGTANDPFVWSDTAPATGHAAGVVWFDATNHTL